MSLGKNEKRARARAFLKKAGDRDDWVVVDTETTGADQFTDEIVEIAILTATGGVLVDQIVQPKKEISPEAAEVHGITEEETEGAPRIGELEVIPWILSRHPVMIYNSDFDTKIIERSCKLHGLNPRRDEWDCRCVMKAYAMAYCEWNEEYESYNWISLEEAVQERGVTTEDVDLHRAAGDAELTRRLIRSFP